MEPEKTTNERRKHARYQIEDIDIQCKMLFATEVNLINMSLGGASINLDKRLNMGSKYTLKVEKQDRSLSLRCTVVWENLAGLRKNEKGDVVPIYEVGIEFDNVLTSNGVELIDFIKNNAGEKSVRMRLTGPRVKIHDTEKTMIVDFNKTYSIKKISAGGMMIDSDQPLAIDSMFHMEIIFEDGTVINLTGRIANSIEDNSKTPVRFDTGIEFMDMSEDDKTKIAQFIEILQNI